MIDHQIGLRADDAVGFRTPLGFVANATVIRMGVDMHDCGSSIGTPLSLIGNFLRSSRNVRILFSTTRTTETGF